MFFKKKKLEEKKVTEEKVTVDEEKKEELLWKDEDTAGGISFKEYKEGLKQENYSPGWEVIDQSFKVLYGEQEPKHYATTMTSRAIFGGKEYLDGYSFYESEHGFLHLVTYGMTNLYSDLDFFKRDYSKWGYEMCMKLNGTVEDNIWACNMLGNLARYTFTTERYFEDHQYVLGVEDSAIKLESDSKITSLIIINDPQLETVDSVHGKVEYLLLVGILWEEAIKIKEDSSLIDVLLEAMKEDNPYFITDMNRTKSYL